MWRGLLPALALLAACDDPGCLRHSQCDKGLECRDAVCQPPLAGEAGPTHDAATQPPPPWDAASADPGDAAVGGDATTPETASEPLTDAAESLPDV